jgi:hypothetical protein
VLTGIDHLVIAVPDVDVAADVLERDVGLRATGGGRHPRQGTVNRLVWFGDSYLELIGVEDASLAASSWIGRPTLDVLERSPDGGFATWAIATDELEAFADLDGPIDGERRRPDGRLVRWRIARAGELAPDRPPFLIEHDVTAAEWTPEERAERAIEQHPVGGPVRLTRLRIAARHPEAVARSVADLLGTEVDGSTVWLGPHEVAYGALGHEPEASVELVVVAGPPGIDLPREVVRFGCRFIVT